MLYISDQGSLSSITCTSINSDSIFGLGYTLFSGVDIDTHIALLPIATTYCTYISP
jgi:hypothetical protein